MSYTVTKIQDDFWAIDIEMVRCYLFIGDDRAVLVDTMYPGDDLAAQVKQLTEKPVIVVNTHADPDHIGCNEQFAEIHMHPADFERYTEFKKDFRCPNPLREGEMIDLGNFSFEIVHIPGHTYGSIALLEREKRFILCGDSVQLRPIFMFGPGRNLTDYINSLEKLVTMRESFDTVYTCHGEIKVSPEHISNLLDAGKRLLAGELTGVPVAGVSIPLPEGTLTYSTDTVSFIH